MIIRLNTAHQFEEALDLATNLLDQAPRFAEVWNQRAIAHFRLELYEAAAGDCQKTLALNPHHFGAAVGLAHCHLELSEGFEALEWFRKAFELNPNLEAVKGQIDFLQRALEET
jgi:tetratricopeptide (TPR) repeat protein